MLERISDSVFRWTERHGQRRGTPYTWNSYAIVCHDCNVFALVDPLAMSEDEVAEIEGMGTPTHILLSCEYHVRNSLTYRERWGSKILANRREAHWYEIMLDGYFDDGQCLWGTVDLTYVPDVKFQETAFLVRDGGGILIVGDLLAGGRPDVGIAEGELALCGPHVVTDLALARKSLRKLLSLEFRILCFAHGTPVWHAAKEKLIQYLDSDEVWDQLERTKREAPSSPELEQERERRKALFSASLARQA